MPALTTAGIYPGTSNVMAAHIVSISRGEYDDNWAYREPPPGEGCCVLRNASIARMAAAATTICRSRSGGSLSGDSTCTCNRA